MLILASILNYDNPIVSNPELVLEISEPGIHLVKRTENDWEHIQLNSDSYRPAYDEITALTLLDL